MNLPLTMDCQVRRDGILHSAKLKWILPQPLPDNVMITLTDVLRRAEYIFIKDSNTRSFDLPPQIVEKCYALKVTVRSQRATTFPSAKGSLTVIGYETLQKGSVSHPSPTPKMSKEDNFVRIVSCDVTRDTYRDATVTWNNLDEEQRDNVLITVKRLDSTREYLFIACGKSGGSFPIPSQLIEAGKYYKVNVRSQRAKPFPGLNTSIIAMGYVTHTKIPLSFRTELTYNDLKELLRRSVAFMKRVSFDPIEVFYRNKPRSYYDDIMMNHNGIMVPYIKDNNGDQASCINNAVDGLFFGVNVERDTGCPPIFSHFGPQRLHIPAALMFKWAPYLYFADFYCNFRAHYVTLVMTSGGSVADKLCREKLIALNTSSNPFLKQGSSGEVLVTNRIHVEVLFTESINIPYVLSDCAAFWSMVSSTGTSRPDGIPKNPNCDLCNLHR